MPFVTVFTGQYKKSGKPYENLYRKNTVQFYKEEHLKDETANDARYTANGYKDRNDYLNTLADDMGIDTMAVHMIADMLGETEDFDGLVTELEDFGYLGMFDRALDDDSENEEEA
jgi:hypothetical protein